MTGRSPSNPVDLAAALAALPMDVAAGILGWSPPKHLWKDTGIGTGEAVECARLWVALTCPPSPRAAIANMWPVFLFAEWCQQHLGDVAAVNVLVPRNVSHWVNTVCAHQSQGWRHRARALLRTIGRIANPTGWPPEDKISARPPATPYSNSDESAFRLAVRLPGRQKAASCMFVVLASCGVGLNGPEMVQIRPDGITGWGGQDLKVAVPGPNGRTVPIRAEYVDLAHRAAALVAPDQPFIATNHRNAVYNIAQRIEVQGLGKLSLSRARSTWLSAHLVGGTPLPALRAIAGPLSVRTLDWLINAAVLSMDSDEAVRKARGI